MRITIDPVAHPDISTITDTRQGHSIAFLDVVVDWPPVPTATRDLYRHHLAPELLGVRNLQRMDAAIDSAELQVGRVLSGFTRGGDPSKGGGRFARLNAIVFSVCESALYWVLLKDNDHRAIFWLPAGLVVFLSFYIGRMLLNSQDAGNRNMVDDGFPSPITSRIIVATSSAVLLLIVSFGSFRGVLFVVITALILFGSHISGLEAMMSDRSIPGRPRSFIVPKLIAILPAIAATVTSPLSCPLPLRSFG